MLDTGNNVDFSVQDRHLREWAGIDPGLLVALGEIEINGQVVTRRRATVWLYPNIPGRQEVDRGRQPFRLSEGRVRRTKKDGVRRRRTRRTGSGRTGSDV